MGGPADELRLSLRPGRGFSFVRMEMVHEAVARWMNELSTQGIFLTDSELRICSWNRWLEIHSGRSSAEMVGRILFEAYPELIERDLEKYYEDALAGQVRLLSHRFHHYLLPMAPEIDIDLFVEMQQSARIAPLLDGDLVIGTITVIEDVTERIAREEQLLRLFDREHAARTEAEFANRMKDEFLATVSHELRTPLNAIAGWIQILRKSETNPGLIAQGVETIDRNVRAQSQIVEDILDVSRIITGKLNLTVKPVDLVETIDAALDSVRLAAQVKEIRLDVGGIRQPAFVAGDPNRLQQIIWNLVSNAIKFTSRGGTVTVRLIRSEAQVELVVGDTGKGISPEFLPFVFDRFRQADSTSTRPHSGLGLGLAIVRYLVELHGGTVQASSLGEGQGATFIVRLPTLATQNPAAPEVSPPPPAAAEEVSTEETAPAPGPQPDLRGIRVLIVDDDADARIMLQILLSQFGAEVRISNSTKAALKQFAQWPPDVLVSDIGMPNEDGYALIKQIRAREAEGGGQIPAIALTGYTRPEDQRQILAAGYQVPMAKPVDVDRLVEVIAALTAANSKSSAIS